MQVTYSSTSYESLTQELPKLQCFSMLALTIVLQQVFVKIKNAQ